MRALVLNRMDGGRRLSGEVEDIVGDARVRLEQLRNRGLPPSALSQGSQSAETSRAAVDYGRYHDSGGGNHSVFAKAFLDAPDDVKGVAFVSSLFNDIKRKVELNSDQRPLYSPIKLAGHDDGDFIFVRNSPDVMSGAKNSP